MKFRIWMMLMVGIVFIPNLKASNLVDTLQERLDDYHREKPVINLYVHLDRNIYAPEDTIWFKAYVLTPILNEVLYVRITDRKKNQVLEKQFPMYDIRAHGDLLIPDTLPEGQYYFYAYTDRMISLNPNDVFVQPITVSKNIMNRLVAEASVTNRKKVHRGDKVEILARVKGVTGKSIKGKFSLWVGEQLLKKGSIATNNLGEAYVRFTYPMIDNTEMVRCEIKFTQDKDFAELILNLRHEGNTAKVNAFAEGGHFLEGLPNHAVFEILDDNKNPMEVPLDLMEDQKIIGRTHTNKHGLGSMLFTPHLNVKYSLAVHENDTTTLLDFPSQIESDGYGLRIENSKDHTTVLLTNRNQKDSATLVLRSMDQIVWSQALTVPNGDSVRIDLPVNEQPKGILNLAVFDSLAPPMAERLFLNKTEDAYKVGFSTTKTVKKGGTSIKVNLSVVDSENNPVATNLSVSIVEKSALNKESYHTILQSYYFKHTFGPGSVLYDEHEPDFNDRLLTMDWGQKSWSNMIRYRPTGYIRLLDNTGGINGFVTSKTKKPIKLDQLMLESTTSADKKDLVPLMKMFQGGSQQHTPFRMSKITYTIKDWAEAVPLSSDGSFTISPKSLLVNSNEQKILKPGVHFSDEYDLQLKDYSVEMDEFVRLGESLNFAQPVNTFTKYDAPVIKTLTKVIELKEVSVESRSGIYEGDNNMGKKEDYVCREYNVFNCRNHRTGGLKPEIGRVYVQSERGALFLYNGVGKPFSPAPDGAVAGSLQYLPIKNISRPNTFYNPEATDSAFLKAETRTTVYWAPNLYTDASGKTSFNCNVSDRSGEFTIVVQGLEVKTRKPIYGTYEFKL
jgi:hypothetical protein